MRHTKEMREHYNGTEVPQFIALDYCSLIIPLDDNGDLYDRCDVIIV